VTHQIRSRHKTAEFQLDSSTDPAIVEALRTDEIPIDCESLSTASSGRWLPSAAVDGTRVILEISKEEQEFIEGSIGRNKHKIMMARCENCRRPSQVIRSGVTYR
jgi:hypothetical protein